MRKRIFSIIVSIALVVGMCPGVPGVALAVGDSTADLRAATVDGSDRTVLVPKEIYGPYSLDQGDAIVFTRTVQRNSLVSVSINQAAGKTDRESMDISIVNSSGREVYSWVVKGSVTVKLYGAMCLPADKYTITVTSRQDGLNLKQFKYTETSSDQLNASDVHMELENNATEPNLLPVDEILAGTIYDPNYAIAYAYYDVDMIRFSIPKDASVKLQLMSQNASTNISAVYDEYGRQVAKDGVLADSSHAKLSASASDGKTVKLDCGTLPAGSYDIQLDGFGATDYAFYFLSVLTEEAADETCALIRNDGEVWSCTSTGQPVARMGYRSRGSVQTIYIASDVTNLPAEYTIEGLTFCLGTHFKNTQRVAFLLDSQGKSACRSLSEEAFKWLDNCKSVVNFDKTAVQALPEGAFQRCKMLESISLPPNITSIGGSAFWRCGALKTIQIPDGCRSIGMLAFRECTSLDKVDLPATVTTIDSFAFEDCSSLSSFTIRARSLVSPRSHSVLDGTPVAASNNSCFIYVPDTQYAKYIAKYASDSSSNNWYNYRTKIKSFKTSSATKAKSITACKVKGVKAKVYTGKKITQNPTVKLGSVTLKRGTDYKLSYARNVKAGVATMSVVGKGNYVGTKSVTFKITKANMKKVSARGVKAQKYSGKAIKPRPQLVFKGIKLKRGVDYTLSYKNNKKRGTATIIMRGKGSFSGKKLVKFRIR